jgi:hypothetical protein
MAYVNEQTVNGRTHTYNASARLLSGHLQLPVIEEIKPQAFAQLREKGGYLSQISENYRLESVIAFRSGYTQVAGNRSSKQDEGWSTLVTTAVEGLNVLDIVTADRIVGQMILEHPLEGYVPRVNFLGTRFENLRIAGRPVELDFDLNVLGSKPANDAAYTQDKGFTARVSDFLSRISGHKDLPSALHQRYNQLSSTLGSPQEEVECSLVRAASGDLPGTSSGHVITIPDFGTIVLGKVTVKHEDFKPDSGVPRKTTVGLTMIEFHFGCPVLGITDIGTGSANGGTMP